MEDSRPLQWIPDDVLLRRLDELTGQARRTEADLVAHIAEVDERRLFARQALPSMFAYCTTVFHFSEAEAITASWWQGVARSIPCSSPCKGTDDFT